MKLKRLTQQEGLRVGGVVPFDVYGSDEVLLIRAGLHIDSKRMLDSIFERDLYIKDSDSSPSQTMARVARAEPENPFDLIDEIETQLDRALHKTGPNGLLDQRIKAVAERVIYCVKMDPDATMATILLDSSEAYSIKHPVNVAIMVEVTLRAYGLSEVERVTAVCAALTMNLGMLDLQDVLHHQSSPLTSHQRDVILSHPNIGMRLLEESGVTDIGWLHGVLHHHEKIDGSGYPRGLIGSDIHQFGRLISILDIFCAKICPRAYRPGILPNVAMREIFIERGRTLDLELSACLVKQVGVYIPGAIVVLANGETAIITRRGSTVGNPIATTLLNSRGEQMNSYLQRDTKNEAYTIKSVSNLEKLGIPINRKAVWSY
jgi:HD-GYP domain-containing protein (c-di-GMP phosphodiesterase class II)